MDYGEEETYRCFRCGTNVEPEEVEVPDGVGVCPYCNETGVLSFTTCIDILNDVYIREPKLLYHITKEYMDL